MNNKLLILLISVDLVVSTARCSVLSAHSDDDLLMPVDWLKLGDKAYQF